mgnify:CR=1 FL=1
MKSITTKPPRSLSLSCLAISTAASKFVFKAVFSIFLSDVFFPEWTKQRSDASFQHFLEGGRQHQDTSVFLCLSAGSMNAGNERNDLHKQMQEIEINYNSPIRVLHYFLPQLKKSNNDYNGENIHKCRKYF